MKVLQRIQAIQQKAPLRVVLAILGLTFLPLLWTGLHDLDRSLIAAEPALRGDIAPSSVFLRETPPGAPHGTYSPLAAWTMARELALDSPHVVLIRASHVMLLLMMIALLFRLCRLLGAAPDMALWAIFLFALHPVHAEMVATLAGRGPLAAHVFGLSALLFLWGRAPGRTATLGAFTLMFLGQLFDVTAFIWCVLPLLWRSPEANLRPGAWRPLALGALTAAAAGWIITGSILPAAAGRFIDPTGFLGHLKASLGIPGADLISFFATPAVTENRGISTTLVQGAPMVLAGTALLALCVAALMRRRKQNSPLRLAGALLLLSILPRMSFLRGSPVDGHAVFSMALALPFFLLGVLPAIHGEGKKRFVLPALAVILVAVNLWRASAWVNEEGPLVTTKSCPGPLGHLKALEKMRSTGQGIRGAQPAYLKATTMLREALECCHEDPRLLKAAFEVEMERFGQVVRAREILEALTRQRPHLPGLKALEGRLLLKSGQVSLARRAFERSIAEDPLDARSRFELGRMMARQLSPDEAEVFWRQALALCRSPEQQKLAITILIQLRPLVQRGRLSPGIFRELCLRQLIYAGHDTPAGRQIQIIMKDGV